MYGLTHVTCSEALRGVDTPRPAPSLSSPPCSLEAAFPRPPRQRWGLEAPAREKVEGKQKQFASGGCSGQAFGRAEGRRAFGQRPLDVVWRFPHVRHAGGWNHGGGLPPQPLRAWISGNCLPRLGPLPSSSCRGFWMCIQPLPL